METIQVESEQKPHNKKESTLKRFLKVLTRTLVWAFLTAAILGGLSSAIWTLIPTEMLTWGSSQVNLMGYVSHCSYTPISTIILVAMSIIAMLLTIPMKNSRRIGVGVLIGGMGGLVIGMLGGLDIVMFIGMGSGIGVGVFLGILLGITSNSKVSGV